MSKTAKDFTGNLPPLSREALLLRLRLAEAFSKASGKESVRLIQLIERANIRFERRERASRELSA